jgi:ribonuclease BN (tRNA processing enzyme)
LKLIVLGSGCCVPQKKRKAPGYLLETSTLLALIDCGSGTLGRIADADRDVTAVELICVSHLHIDHSGDLTSILFALRNSSVVTVQDLKIIGPPGFPDHLRKLEEIYGDWIRPGEPSLEVGTAEEMLEIKNLKIKTFPLRHSTPTIGFRYEAEEGVVAYGADSGYCKELIRLGRGADLLILECSFPDSSPSPGHLTPSEAGRIAREAGAGQLLLTHFYPETDPVRAIAFCEKEYDGTVTAATDGEVIEIHRGKE